MTKNKNEYEVHVFNIMSDGSTYEMRLCEKDLTISPDQMCVRIIIDLRKTNKIHDYICDMISNNESKTFKLIDEEVKEMIINFTSKTFRLEMCEIKECEMGRYWLRCNVIQLVNPYQSPHGRIRSGYVHPIPTPTIPSGVYHVATH